MQAKRVTAPKPPATKVPPAAKQQAVAPAAPTVPTCTRKTSENPVTYCNTPLIVKIKKEDPENPLTSGAEYYACPAEGCANEFKGNKYPRFVRYVDTAIDALVKAAGKEKTAEKKRLYDEMVQSMPTDIAAIREQVQVMYSKVARIEEILLNGVEASNNNEPTTQILDAETTQQV